MPMRPRKYCTHGGCSSFRTTGTRCDKHQVKSWATSKKSASDRGYGAEWRRIRKTVIESCKGLCTNCLKLGIYTAGVDVDHIVSKGEGGTDDFSNLTLLCKPCHKAKTATESKQSRLDSDG